MTEIWKDFPEMPIYEVSTDGRIRNKIAGNILKGSFDKDGYKEYHLRDGGKNLYRRGHRMVAITYLDNPENKPVINHINGVKDDNRLSNLEWATISENTQHGFDILGRKGQNGGTNKRILLQDLDGNEVETFESMKEASWYLGISVCSVSSYFKRKDRLGLKATIKKRYRAEIV